MRSTGLNVLAVCSLIACAEPAIETPVTPPAEIAAQYPELITPTDLAIDLNPDPNVVEIDLVAAPSWQTLLDGDDGPVDVPMWTYNGQFPGPTIQATVGDEVVVHFRNDLDEPTTVHWHGLRVSDQMDGNPRIQDPVQPGETFTYRYVVNEAGSYWYHPHMRTHEQMDRGLVGTLVVHELEPPAYDRERFVVFDDILLASGGVIPGFMRSGPEMVHGRTGNVLLTDGFGDSKTIHVKQGEVERWRIVNTTNARTFDLGFKGGNPWVIATDGGLLGVEHSFRAPRLELPVGQRYDLEMSYDEAGEFEVVGYFLSRDENGDIVTIEIPVVTVVVEPTGIVPRRVRLPEAPVRAHRAIDREVTLEFDAVNDPERGLVWRINGKAHWMDGPIFTFDEGETVKINLVNKVGPEHPFHLHGQWFEVLNDGRWFTDRPGLKDTVRLPGMERLSIVASFDNPGRWMAHCHIAEHAELGMMGEIVVVPRD
jgi:FtsP/CotA-like multicopper oxidase with cupredoxin domain